LQYDAEHDALTGLTNRNLFTTHAGRALDRRHSARHGTATLVIGLDDSVRLERVAGVEGTRG
jgi:GGDEF domain-containing protein